MFLSQVLVNTIMFEFIYWSYQVVQKQNNKKWILKWNLFPPVSSGGKQSCWITQKENSTIYKETKGEGRRETLSVTSGCGRGTWEASDSENPTSHPKIRTSDGHSLSTLCLRFLTLLRDGCAESKSKQYWNIWMLSWRRPQLSALHSTKWIPLQWNWSY